MYIYIYIYIIKSSSNQAAGTHFPGALFLHPSLSSIAPGKSSKPHLVSAQSCFE